MKGVDRSGIAVAKVKAKTMRAKDGAVTDRDLRLRRDLLWQYLHSQGMSPAEIERTCKFANRKERNIRQRLIELQSRQAKGQRRRDDSVSLTG